MYALMYVRRVRTVDKIEVMTTVRSITVATAVTATCASVGAGGERDGGGGTEAEGLCGGINLVSRTCPTGDGSIAL